MESQRLVFSVLANSLNSAFACKQVEKLVSVLLPATKYKQESHKKQRG